MITFRILLIFLYSTTWCITSATGQQIRIMTYNIHHGADAMEEPTLDSMASYIGVSQVDIVGLQEVDSICKRSEMVDQARKLGEGAGMDHYFTRHFPYQGGAYGQGLLTTFPVTNLRNLRLPVFPLEKGSEVSVLMADISPRPDKKMTVGVIHLDYRSSESRMHQIELLLDALKNTKNLVLVGDFNVYPESPEMKKLMDTFDRYTSESDPPTFPAVNPDRRIDFILVKKNADLKVINETVGQIPYSDHLPVIATLEWKY